MRRLVWILGLAFFFLNPGFACGLGDPEYQYGAAEMRAAVEGTWSLTITPEGGTSSQVTIRIEQDTKAPGATAQLPEGGLVRAAHACGTRTLVKAAGACGDSSQMPVAVTFVDGDAALAGMGGTGMFNVYGLAFLNGELSFTFGGFALWSQISADGVPSNPRLGFGATQGTVVMTRVN